MEAEMEIDPLSMLEQSMQVNEGPSLSSNIDEDYVMVLDGETDEEQVKKQPSKSDKMNGGVKTAAPVLEPAVLTAASLQQEEVLNFGEHFLAGPQTDYNSHPPGSPQVESPLPKPIKYVRKVVRTKHSGPRRIKSARSAVPNRNKALSIVAVAPSVLKLHGLDAVSKIKSKLITNIKRLSIASSEEFSYRHKVFSDLSKVLNGRLDCTACGQHIGCSINLNICLSTHPLLKVLACSKCCENYNRTDWTLGSDNKDHKCRWCSKPPSTNSRLCNCFNCPFAFCEACIVQNFSRRDCNRILKNENWLCFVCQMIPLFFMRATCWALQMFITSLSRRKLNSRYQKDMSKCCKDDIIDLMDETDTADSSLGVEANGEDAVSATDVSTLPVSSRIDLLFSSIDNIKRSVTSRLNEPLYPTKVDGLVSDLNLSLAKIGTNLESCLNYIENWRCHTIKSLKEQEETKGKTKPATLAKGMNGRRDYSSLLEKYNIKPCKVVVERVDSIKLNTETSEPPNFFLSLVPSPSPTEQSLDTKVDISLLEDTDDDIICLDD